MKSYLIDTTYLTLDEFCFRSNSRKFQQDTNGKCRDVIDAFRVVYWFHGLRIQLGDAARNLHAIEKQLEPEAFGISRDGVRYRRNKWRWYRIGLHTPLESLVMDIDSRYEGSRMEFFHVLWDTLQLRHPISLFIDTWIQRLEPSVQVLLWEKPSKKTATTGRVRRRKLDKRTLEVLERRAGLDALACLTILLREAHAIGDSKYAHELGYRLCRMLLLISLDLFSHGIANPLYEYYDQLILPLALYQGTYQTYRAIHFLDLMSRSLHALHHINGVDALELTLEETRRYRQKVLGWDYGWDYFHVFNPVAVPVDRSLIESDAFQHYWKAQCDLRQWAWDAIAFPSTHDRAPAALWVKASQTRKEFEQYQASIAKQLHS